MLVSFDDESIDPSKVSFVGKISEKQASGGPKGTASYSVMFKYIVDGVVLSVVRDSMEVAEGNEEAKDAVLKPVREYIAARRAKLLKIVDEWDTKNGKDQERFCLHQS